jgi:hypothetical protein
VTRGQGILAGALAAQIGLALFSWNAAGPRADTAEPARPLWNIAATDVRAVEIVGEPGENQQRVELSATDDGWVLASADGYPALSEKVDDLFTQLLAATVRQPVVTQSVSHDAMHVGDRDYGRRVTLVTDGARRTVIMGAGPRSSVHVRLEGEDDVYVAAGMNLWAIRADAKTFIEPFYVNVDRQQLTGIVIENEHGTLTFSNDDDGWTLAELPAGAQQDAAAVGTIINALSRLTVQTPIGGTDKPEYGLASGVRVTLAWSEDGKLSSLAYVVGAAAGDDGYYAKADTRAHIVIVPKWAAEQAIDKQVSDFVAVPEQPDN